MHDGQVRKCPWEVRKVWTQTSRGDISGTDEFALRARIAFIVMLTLAIRCCGQIARHHCLSTTAAHSPGKSSSWGTLATLALGGAVLGVGIQQTLISQPSQHEASGPASSGDGSSAHDKLRVPATHEHAQGPDRGGTLTATELGLAAPAPNRDLGTAPAAAGELQGPWFMDEDMELVLHRR